MRVGQEGRLASCVASWAAVQPGGRWAVGISKSPWLGRTGLLRLHPARHSPAHRCSGQARAGQPQPVHALTWRSCPSTHSASRKKGEVKEFPAGIGRDLSGCGTEKKMPLHLTVWSHATTSERSCMPGTHSASCSSATMS